MNYFSQKGEHKVCQYCGMPYVQTRIKQETCGSYECKKLRKRHLYQINKGGSPIFIIAMTKKCPICEKMFIPETMNSIVCKNNFCKKIWEKYRNINNLIDKKGKCCSYKNKKRLRKGYFYEYFKEQRELYEKLSK